MEWLHSINNAINYIEDNLTKNLNIKTISDNAYTSSSHFQRIFNIVTGITLGEYIRNRRLSLAANELLSGNEKVIDIALKYGYETPESFQKAFHRFHGINPSEVKMKRAKLKFYYPLKISIAVDGGFSMINKIIEEFYWGDFNAQANEKITDKEKYQMLIDWAGKARGTNPNVFDDLTEWLLDDNEWAEEKLIENEQILIHGVFARFKEQNAKLREHLKLLDKSPDIVNKAIFTALDRFDAGLSGISPDERINIPTNKMFTDFSAMKDRDIRLQIAGERTGSTGTNSVDIFGYINFLKDCDANVQWALFMPQTVERQQNGFKVETFEYKTMPAMRFIGVEADPGNWFSDDDIEKIFSVLDDMTEYKSGFDYDMLLEHHYGKGVDVERWHGFYGRFMKADTPVPDGFIHFDFAPDDTETPYLTFRSQFAFSTFSGDTEAMHKSEGYDVSAMYDVTRNIMLGQGVMIPYPHIYWTAEVFIDGYKNPSTAYMFSAIL